jgi:hypothetical protein
MVGVQWHPEDLTGTDEPWDRRFSAFADEVRAARGEERRHDSSRTRRISRSGV